MLRRIIGLMSFVERVISSTRITGQTDRDETGQPVSLESKLVAILTLLMAGIGIAFRLQRYFLGRSFRGDEAALALAIQAHSLFELLTRPLGGHLTAPVSFVVVEKLSVLLWGGTDFIYRIFPLVAGIGSVALMYCLARQLIDGVGAFFCIGAFALNWNAAFYASDLKQYSSDIFIALLLYIAAARYFQEDSPSNTAILGIIGVLGISFSHPAIFLLACIGPVLLLRYRSQRQALLRSSALCAVWVMTFLALYMLFYRSVGQEAYIVDYWNDLNGLMPMPPWKDPSWFPIRISSFFTTVLGLSSFVPIPIVLYVAGLLSFARRGKWQWSAWFFGPVLATLFASAVANYPFKGRLILFLIPSALLVIGEGVEWMSTLFRARRWLTHGLVWLLAGFLLLAPTATAWRIIQQPRSTPYREDIKPALAFVQANRQPGDMIVVYDQAIPTYQFYAPFYGLSTNSTFLLPDYRKQPNKYRGIIDALPRDQRIWFIFSSVLDVKDHLDERTYMLDYLRSTGGQVVQEQSVSGGFSSAQLTIIK